MIELKGKYNTVDEASVVQVMLLLNQEFVTGSKIGLMPDIHAGTGRLMSRSQAKVTFTVSEFKRQMDGIFITSVNNVTLDECPMAYKGMEDIINYIGETAQPERVIKPIYNFKAGGE